MEHRHDIDVLRVCAVWAVLVHHALPGWLPGGFLGVDVFFVLSGYLITGLLVAEWSRSGRVDLWAFMQRRFLRIVPAMAMVVGVVLAVGWLWELPWAYAFTGKTALAALVGLANVEQGYGLGYFDPAVSENPLAHIWSLSVEMQFYAFWGSFVVAMFWVAPWALKWVVCVLCLGGFAWAVWVYPVNPDWAYYRVDARLWQFACGGVLALFHIHRPVGWGVVPMGGEWGGSGRRSLWRRVLNGWGFWYGVPWFVLVLALWWGVDGLSHPGIGTLPVVLAVLWCLQVGSWRLLGGGCAVFAWGQRGRVWRTVVAGFVGILARWSYALYLVHWPVYVALWVMMGRSFTPIEALGAMLMSLVLAVYIHQAVENPARRVSVVWRGWAVGGWLVVLFVGFCVAVSVVASRGYPQRVPAAVAALESVKEVAPERVVLLRCHATADLLDSGVLDRPCVLGGTGLSMEVPGWALLGDSHGMALATGVLASGTGSPFLVLTGNGCPPVLRDEVLPHRRCGAIGRRALSALDAHPEVDTVVLHARWSWYTTFRDAESWKDRSVLEAVDEMIEVLRSRGLRVVLVGPIPEQTTDVARAAARWVWAGGALEDLDVSIPREIFDARHLRVRTWFEAWSVRGVVTFWPEDVVCGPKVCEGVGASGEVWYVDSHHLSPVGALRVALPLLDWMKRLGL